MYTFLWLVACPVNGKLTARKGLRGRSRERVLWRRAPARQASPLWGGQPTLMALARQARTRQGES